MRYPSAAGFFWQAGFEKVWVPAQSLALYDRSYSALESSTRDEPARRGQ